MNNADDLKELKDKEELTILKDPNLFERIIEELDKRIIGEDKSKRAIFLSLCSVWLKNTEVPIHTLVSSESSAGKSYVCRQIKDIFPKDRIIYRSKISGEVFSYWHTNEDDWTWDNKILYLEDIKQDLLDSPTFKVMLSEGSIATIVRNQKAVELEVNGKPNVLITTAETNPKKEILNRFQIIGLDESTKQTEDVTFRQAEDIQTPNYKEEILKALTLLENKRVYVPFAKKIHKFITYNYGWADIRMRRDFERLKDLIKCSAVLHQYQRETDDKGRLLATEKDYEIAKGCINYITSTTLKGLIHKLKKAYDFCIKEQEFTAKDIHALHPFVSEAYWYRILDKLCERNLLLTELRMKEGVKQRVTYFSVPKQTSFNLPDYQDLDLEPIKDLEPDSPSEQEELNIETIKMGEQK